MGVGTFVATLSSVNYYYEFENNDKSLFEKLSILISEQRTPSVSL